MIRQSETSVFQLFEERGEGVTSAKLLECLEGNAAHENREKRYCLDKQVTIELRTGGRSTKQGKKSRCRRLEIKKKIGMSSLIDEG